MKVEAVSLKRQTECWASEYEAAVLRVLHSGWYVLGREVETFEQAFSEFLGVKHCIGVGNGQDALILAVRALGIGTGDEVIVPSNTYIASVLGITENGATPVFVEPDKYLNIDAEKIEAAITERTKAILPVHLYGQACDMQAICAVAEKYGLKIIEDCAQSHGAASNGKQTGTFGDMGCFSFYPTKPLGAFGDGGALVTNDDALAKKCRMLRNYGSGRKYVNEIEGINSRLDEMQAAILQVGLKHLEEGNAYRARIAEKYLAEIKNACVRLPETRETSTNTWHVFPVLCENRDALQSFLQSKGVKTLCHYPVPPHLQQCYRRLGYGRGDFPLAESIAAQELSLPIYVGMPMEEVEHVIASVNQYMNEKYDAI